MHRMAGPFRVVGLAALVAALGACGERRDTAELAGGVAPFTELRGVNAAALRAGQVRAIRAGAEPAPFEGLREPIGAFDVMFEVPGFVGTDSSWPLEEARVMGIEATREWPSDSAAAAAFDSAVTEIRNTTGATPHCVNLVGPGFSLRVVEFDRGGGWTLAAALAPETRLANRSRLSARHSIAVREGSVMTRFPEAGTPNPDERPTWSRVECAFTN
jgi:hypothetical protein